MRKLLLSMVCVSIGCGSTGTEQEDPIFGKLDGVEDRGDLKVVGDIASGETSRAIEYSGKPKYRALRFHARAGDKVDAWVRSTDGDAMGWLADADGKVLAKNDDADLDVTDAHVAATLERDADAFYVIFREASQQRASFKISLSGAPPPAPAGPTLQVGAAPARGDGFTMVDAAIEGDDLVVSVRYGGGCEKHDFALFWDGKALETSPPKVTLTLVHDGHGDACEAIKGERLRFALAPLASIDAESVTVTLRGGDVPATLTYRPARVPALIVGAATGPRDGFRAENLRIEGNVLKLTARYGGGCEEHTFKLFWDGRLLETFPAQAHLVLAHDGHGDACESFGSSDLTFDLAPLGKAAGGKVALSIEGGDKPLTIQYDPK